MLLTIILLSVRVISSISPSILVVVVAVKERDWIGLDWPDLAGWERDGLVSGGVLCDDCLMVVDGLP